MIIRIIDMLQMSYDHSCPRQMHTDPKFNISSFFSIFCPSGLFSERDLVGTQLVRRNDEMACLNEKLKLQNTRMGCGEVHYNSRVKDIQVLSREVGSMSGGGLMVGLTLVELFLLLFSLILKLKLFRLWLLLMWFLL